jgi:hypothetical protein
MQTHGLWAVRTRTQEFRIFLNANANAALVMNATKYMRGSNTTYLMEWTSQRLLQAELPQWGLMPLAKAMVNYQRWSVNFLHRKLCLYISFKWFYLIFAIFLERKKYYFPSLELWTKEYLKCAYICANNSKVIRESRGEWSLANGNNFGSKFVTLINSDKFVKDCDILYFLH